MKPVFAALAGLFRTVVAVSWTVIACTLALGVLAFSKRFSGWVLTRIGGRLWSANQLRWVSKGLRIELPPEGGWPHRAIYIANHASQLDINVIFASIPHPVIFLSKASIRKVPFLGWANARVGTVFVERGQLDSAKRAAQDLEYALNDGKVVCVFPEGTRSPDGTLLPFKLGAFRLAIDAGVPIVPMWIGGTQRALPKGAFLIQKEALSVRFGAPIYPGEFESTKDYAGYGAAARKAMLDLA